MYIYIYILYVYIYITNTDSSWQTGPKHQNYNTVLAGYIVLLCYNIISSKYVYISFGIPYTHTHIHACFILAGIGYYTVPTTTNIILYCMYIHNI